jgi:GrpB-like predicted nucleotidyltransferase (UPF0157 family)
MKIRLVPSDASWPDDYRSARDEILACLGDGCLAGIEHVGSTAIPGLAAKPVIDMVAAVHDVSLIEEIAEKLAPLGYTAWHSTPGRRTLQRRDDRGNATEHLHIVALDSREWRNQIRFRDLLRAEPTLRIEYEKLKFELADRYEDTQDYSEAKSSFIQGLLEKRSD